MKKLIDFKYEYQNIEEKMYMLYIQNQKQWQFLGFVDENRLNGLSEELKAQGDELLNEDGIDLLGMMTQSLVGEGVDIYEATYVVVPVQGTIPMFSRIPVYKDEEKEDESK